MGKSKRNERRLPTEKEVHALSVMTGESPRKCFYWLLAEMDRKRAAINVNGGGENETNKQGKLARRDRAGRGE